MPVNADAVLLRAHARMTIACWECEALTSHSVEVPIPVPSRMPRMVRLCQACYRSCYLPLTAGALSEWRSAAVLN
jgi:hypothetical protein